MKIGCVKEIKNNEFRVGLTPDNVRAYIAAGHHVYIEKDAGVGSGFSDNEYVDAGASLIDNAADVWHLVDMMVKVKEPLECEYPLFRPGLILYTYLHLAADKQQMDALLAGQVHAVAYETLQEKDRSLPLLAPMSQIAGRLSIQEGAKYLEKKFGGEGILLAGVPGTPKANVVILGGGTVGMNACKIAVGMGANVTILDISLKRLEELDNMFGAHIQTLVSNDSNVERVLKDADLVIGSVLIPGGSTPKLFKKKYLPEMKHPKINMYYLSNGRVCVAVPDEIANQIFEAEREQLTDELSPATMASIKEAKAAISEGRVMPKAELSKKRKEYNNMYNEGAEGYNPFDYYLTTEYVEHLKAEHPNQF